MGRPPFRYGPIAALVAALALSATSVHAQEGPSAPAFATVAEPALILARLSTDPRSPDGYSAHLELHLKLRSFPYVGLTVHGTSSYRKPGLYHYELQNVPRIASRFSDLRYDLGDPTSWSARYDITMAPESSEDAPTLRLTPKKPGQVAYLDIQSDARHGRMLKATWQRHDGGTIVLTQTYSAMGNTDVVTQQHATIDIPHMRAELTATYSSVRVDTATLATVP